MKNITLNQWLQDNGYKAYKEADEIWIGQELTQEEALRIRSMLNRAYLDSRGFEVWTETEEMGYPEDFPLLMLMSKLIDDGAESISNWCEAIEHTFYQDKFFNMGTRWASLREETYEDDFDGIVDSGKYWAIFSSTKKSSMIKDWPLEYDHTTRRWVASYHEGFSSWHMEQIILEEIDNDLDNHKRAKCAWNDRASLCSISYDADGKAVYDLFTFTEYRENKAYICSFGVHTKLNRQERMALEYAIREWHMKGTMNFDGIPGFPSEVTWLEEDNEFIS